MTTVGTVKEVKDNENRVGLTPAGVKKLVSAGHTVLVQRSAGENSGFFDSEYADAGATMVDTPEEVAKNVDILVKVKEPVLREFPLLELLRGKTLYTYLHLSGVDPALTDKLLEYEVTGIAYETVEDEKGELPLLAPMSEVAGVLAAQYGAQYLQKKYNGIGVSLGSIHGADPAETVVVGAGTVGATAARTAAGMGGHVTVLNRNEKRLNRVKEEFRALLGEKLFANVTFTKMDESTLSDAVKKADLVVGAVLVPGARAPIVVTEAMVKSMKKGAVLVDVSIDQGGCVWGSKPTSHAEPIYEIEGKIFCCITNMPGQVARQSTQALTFATLPYLVMMADRGVVEALKESVAGDSRFAKGCNTMKGKITYEHVANDLGLKDRYVKLEDLL